MYIYNNEHNILSGSEIKTIFIHNIILSINKSEVSNRRRKINFFSTCFYIHATPSPFHPSHRFDDKSSRLIYYIL